MVPAARHGDGLPVMRRRPRMMRPMRYSPQLNGQDRAAAYSSRNTFASRAAGRVVKGRVEVFVLGLWFALVVSLLELPALALKAFGLGHFVFLSHHVVWMAPVGYLVLFMGLAAVLWLASLTWAPASSVRTAAFVFTLLGALGILLVFRQDLHVAARALLALGLAVHVARLVARDPDRLVGRARRSAPWLALLVVLLGTTVAVWDRVHERRAIAAGEAPASGTPHIFLFILDTVRASSMSLYGYDEPTTPNLERWVADRGVRFEMALATSAWSLASHASILTGRYPCETGADWESRLDRRLPTLPAFLSAHGYATGGFVANNRYVSRDTRLNHGFARYEDFRLLAPLEILRHASLGAFVSKTVRGALGIQLKEGFKDARRVNQDILAWLERAPQDRPVFVFANYMDAHMPYQPPEPFNQAFGAPRIRGLPERAAGRLSRMLRLSTAPPRAMSWLEENFRRYNGEIAYLDSEMGRLFEELERRGYLDNALILVTSDHGEDFLEQGDVGHSDHLYLETVLRVPLLAAWTGRIPAGIAIAEPVSIRQIPATVGELLELEHPFPASPLTAYWDGSDDDREDFVLAELTRHPLHGVVEYMRALATDSLHFIRNGDGSRELYDFRRDAWQRHDLAAAAPAELDRLDEKLDRIVTSCTQNRQLPSRLTQAALEAETNF
jgi:arylsulfatase A-like enzyme